MIPPRIPRIHLGWQPLMVVVVRTIRKPEHAHEHFLVNSTRQAISRAMVSSRIEHKQTRKD